MALPPEKRTRPPDGALDRFAPDLSRDGRVDKANRAPTPSFSRPSSHFSARIADRPLGGQAAPWYLGCKELRAGSSVGRATDFKMECPDREVRGRTAPYAGTP